MSPLSPAPTGPGFQMTGALETAGPIEAKFHVNRPWDGGTKVCSSGPGHKTKMADMLLYG